MSHDRKRRVLNAEAETIACQLEAFRKKFGRDPCPDDPVFFDPDAEEPVPLNPQEYEQEMIETMGQAGIDAERQRSALACPLSFTGRFRLRHLSLTRRHHAYRLWTFRTLLDIELHLIERLTLFMHHFRALTCSKSCAE